MGVFTREDQETLNYDEDAFFYFAGSILLIVIVPWTLHLGYQLVFPTIPGDQLPLVGATTANARRADVRKRRFSEPPRLREKGCATDAMEEKRRRLQAARVSKDHRFRLAIRLQLVGVLLLWICFSWVLYRLQFAKDLRSFDPHEILGIAKDADEAEIKRAYRRMSLISHPDKNPDDPTATATFQKVTKAYQALTDKQARKNYEKYGNPDGPTGMKVSVALHPAMMEKKNQMITLCSFFFLLFVVVPSCALWYYFSNKDYSSNGILIETLQVLNVCIDRFSRATDGAGLLAASLEARRLAKRKNRADMADVLRAIAEQKRSARSEPGAMDPGCIVEICDLVSAKELNGKRGPIKSFAKDKGRYEIDLRGTDKSQTNTKLIKPENLKILTPCPYECPFEDGVVQRAYFLLLAHTMRKHDAMSKEVRWEVDQLLRHSLLICRAMVGLACNGPGDRSRFFECAKSFVDFQRSLVQASTVGAPPLLQVPHVTESMLEASPELKTMSLRDLAQAPEEFLAKVSGLRPEEELDIKLFSQHLPMVEIEAQVFVDDEDVIAENDIGTLKVILRRKNLEEGVAAGPVHAPLFPSQKYESWWLLVQDDVDGRLVASEVINDQGHEVESLILFQVSHHGEFKWTVHACSDSYAGLDVSAPVSFCALRQKAANRKIFVHPNDVNIRSLFEELMLGLQPPESDDDSDSDDEPPVAKVVKAGAGASAGGVQQRKQESEGSKPTPPAKQSNDDDSSEDESAGPEGSIYKIVGPQGVHVFIDAESEEDQYKISWLPQGRLVRGVEEVEVAGGAKKMLVMPSPGPERPPTYLCISKRVPHDMTFATCLGPLLEQPLRNVVNTVTPLTMVGRWCKHNAAKKIDKLDICQVQGIENDYARSKVLSYVQDRLGFDRFAELNKQVREIEAKRDELVAKVRGVYVQDGTQDGRTMRWRVSADLVVQGGDRERPIRDKLEIDDDGPDAGRIRLGPFVLDENKTHGRCCWSRIDMPGNPMVWKPDRSLGSRMYFMW